MKNTKSIVLAKFLKAGYNLTVASKFYDKMEKSGLSSAAMLLLVSELVVEREVRHSIIRELEVCIDLVKYIDSLSICDYAKSVFIGMAAHANIDNNREFLESEIEKFVEMVDG